MDWQDLFRRVNLPFTMSPDVQAVIVATVLIAGAVAIGWYVGLKAGGPLSLRLQKIAGDHQATSAKAVSAFVQGLVISLLLLVVGNYVSLNTTGRVVMALALGVSVGFLVLKTLRAAEIHTALAVVIAAIALLAVTTAALGGMAPLIASLDGVGLSVGKRRLSLLGLINAVVIVAILYILARAANHVVHYLLGRATALDLSQRVLAQKVGGLAVIAVAVLLGVDLLGIDLTALTVFSGAVGLAVGFGLQKTFGNLIAGLILLMDRSVKPGDVIVVGDTFGAISRIGVRAVSVVTRDGKEHLIPNEQLMTERVENWSYSSRNVRLHIPVGVSYGSDIALAQKLMVEAAVAVPRVLKEPGPSIWLTGFGDSSVDHAILAWIADPELGVGKVKSDILNRLWVLFAENGIEIPFPQRDIHVRSITAMAPDDATGGPDNAPSEDV